MPLIDTMIFQLLDSRSTGGIETHVLNLSRWLIKQGFKCQVLFLKNHGPHPLKQQLNEAQVPWRTLSGIEQLHKIITHTPCLLATHGYKAGIIGRAVTAFSHSAVVSTYHSGDRGCGRLRCYSAIDELSAVFANSVISVSREIAKRLPVKSNQVPNFVDVPAYSANTGKEIAFVGRLSMEKGPDTFAQVASRFSDVAPIGVYGEGPMFETLSSRFPGITWHGRVTMDQHWSNIGLVCITSRSEGLPLVALEAMARGIPVISYALGGLVQLIDNGHNGWLIAQRDTQQFSVAIKHWLDLDDCAKQQLSTRAHQRIKSAFSSDVVGPKILCAYDCALKEGA